MYVTTFYSYKGGVGRTMALVNVAVLLAKTGKRVLVVDFDLEAPGLPSFDVLECGRGSPGLVDYVEQYRRELVAPEVSDLIVKCAFADASIWLLPSGDNAAPGYTDRLNAIDWDELYSRESGYLMFEDMKQQWAAHDGKGFDYVLIDSRTGHTDVGGICTRQLPDAVVVLFVPNGQNVDGLQPIVNAIREESKRRTTEIKLHFCPSNVPDEYDEHGILERLLAAASEKLGYDDRVALDPPVTIIHHRTSLELLEQPLVALERPRSLLAKEYEQLHTAIISRNLADRDGAIVALERLPDVYEAARDAGRSRMIGEVADELSEIRRLHPNDGEIALEASNVFSIVGDFEQATASLTIAIASEHRVARARVMRAVSFMNQGRRDMALDDLRAAITSPESTSFEFSPAVQLLRVVLEDPVPAARELFLDPDVKVRAKLLLAPLLMTNDENLATVAKEMLRVASTGGLPAGRASEALNTAALALIGLGRFEEAVASALPRPDASVPQLETAQMFNLAIARWALDGRPPEDLFGKLRAEMPVHLDGDANATNAMRSSGP